MNHRITYTDTVLKALLNNSHGPGIQETHFQADTSGWSNRQPRKRRLGSL